jgi:hypothetical protein
MILFQIILITALSAISFFQVPFSSLPFHYRDRFTFVRLYKQYVRPHLEFASQAWSPWLAGDREVLEKVQKKAVGIVSGL